MKAYFYDIESLENVWTLCNFRPAPENVCDIFYLVDDPALTADPDMEKNLLDAVHQANKNFDGGIRLYDLHEMQSMFEMTRMFGMSDSALVNNPDYASRYPDEFRPVCDTDPGYDPDIHPYFMGYNSSNYDTTMLALFFNDAWEPVEVTDPATGVKHKQALFRPVTARYLRMLNNELFSDRFRGSMPSFLACPPKFSTQGNIVGYGQAAYQDVRWKIRKNMIMSGRQIDVANLNEKARHVGLKRLIGMLGGQILESDRLRPGVDRLETPQDFYDLVAYNVSDCVNLKLKVFDHPVYQGQFDLKKKLLEDYPELVYERDLTQTRHVPDVRPEKVRKDRLFIDSSSAQLATKSLCPYGHLTDIPAVSFMYPHESKARELGIPRVNVLEETRKFFYSKFPQPGLRAEFDKIYKYYKAIEGRNFNESRNYAEDYGMDTPNPRGLRAESTKDLPKTDLCLFYYNADGTPSSGFVTFSIGGIHGAEYNKSLYESDLAAWQEEYDLMLMAQAQYPDPRDLKTAKKVILEVNGEEVSFPAGRFLKSGSTAKNASYKDLLSKKPRVFKTKKDSDGTALNPNYTFTSADPTNHEDFTSYYPNMLRMMAAFYNEGLGYDRYAEIFQQKQDLGVLMKPKNANLTPEQAAKYAKLRKSSGQELAELIISDMERAVYAVQREGTKLVLNSASGAADATFESNIRMNNQIISMRIIGQLFSYRIGQAQTFYGAKVTSTNTDGLFTVMEADQNNKILEQESHDIGVEIEPEPTYLISKDTNNRIEMDIKSGKVQAASGGTLSCRSWADKGPSPTKSLAHPAIIDWALCEYLVFSATDRSGRAGLDKPFNPEVGYNILKSAADKMDKRRLLNMYQNVVASSPSSVSYIFYTKPGKPYEPHNMQHYNRVFIMKDKSPDTVHLHMAVSRKLTPVQMSKRMANGERPQQHDPIAVDILERNGVRADEISLGWEAGIKKVTNIEDTWYMLIENHDLEYLDDAYVDYVIANLDYGKYLYLLGDCFESNWRNHLPGGMPATRLLPFTEDLDRAMQDFRDGKLSAPPEKPSKPEDTDAAAKPKSKKSKSKKKSQEPDAQGAPAVVSDPTALPDESGPEADAMPPAQEGSDEGADSEPDPEAESQEQDGANDWEDLFPGQEPHWDGPALTKDQIRRRHEDYLKEHLNPYGVTDAPCPPDQIPDLDNFHVPKQHADAILAQQQAASQEPAANGAGDDLPPWETGPEETGKTGANTETAAEHGPKAEAEQLSLPGFAGDEMLGTLQTGRRTVASALDAAIGACGMMLSACPEGTPEHGSVTDLLEALHSIQEKL